MSMTAPKLRDCFDAVAASTDGALPLASLCSAAMASSNFTRCPIDVTVAEGHWDVEIQGWRTGFPQAPISWRARRLLALATAKTINP
jgi:hypothetical protein